MKIVLFLFFSGICLAGLGGCYHDTQQELYGISTTPTQCPAADTIGETYSVTIAPIIAANCGTCHSGSATSGGGIALDNYNALVKQANTNNNLMGDINHLSGHNAMPQTGGMLDVCTILKIQHWIDIGKPNN